MKKIPGLKTWKNHGNMEFCHSESGNPDFLTGSGLKLGTRMRNSN